uniref:Uncharacterized protein n=1 Tax=Oryza brachyantha TaxID=4533 RepID=J3LW64_ORYBR
MPAGQAPRRLADADPGEADATLRRRAAAVLAGLLLCLRRYNIPELAKKYELGLLNSTDQFGDPNRPLEETAPTAEESAVSTLIMKPLKEAFQLVVLGFLFWQAKQPARVEKVLKSVYKDTTNVDDYTNTGEAYYRLMSQFMANQSRYTL